MTHELKILPQYFERVLDGSKTFEVRKNDRGFQMGDTVILKEYDPDHRSSLERHKYTDRELEFKIGYVCSNYQKEGYVTFSLIDVKSN